MWLGKNFTLLTKTSHYYQAAGSSGRTVSGLSQSGWRKSIDSTNHWPTRQIHQCHTDNRPRGTTSSSQKVFNKWPTKRADSFCQARRNVFVSGGVRICTNLIQSCTVKVVCLKFFDISRIFDLGGTRGTNPKLGGYNVPRCPHSSDATGFCQIPHARYSEVNILNFVTTVNWYLRVRRKLSKTENAFSLDNLTYALCNRFCRAFAIDILTLRNKFSKYRVINNVR